MFFERSPEDVAVSSGTGDLSNPGAEAILVPPSALNHLYLICSRLQKAQVPLEPYLDGDKLLLGGVLVGRANFLPSIDG